MWCERWEMQFAVILYRNDVRDDGLLQLATWDDLGRNARSDNGVACAANLHITAGGS